MVDDNIIEAQLEFGYYVRFRSYKWNSYKRNIHEMKIRQSVLIIVYIDFSFIIHFKL